MPSLASCGWMKFGSTELDRFQHESIPISSTVVVPYSLRLRVTSCKGYSSVHTSDLRRRAQEQSARWEREIHVRRPCLCISLSLASGTVLQRHRTPAMHEVGSGDLRYLHELFQMMGILATGHWPLATGARCSCADRMALLTQMRTHLERGQEHEPSMPSQAKPRQAMPSYTKHR